METGEQHQHVHILIMLLSSCWSETGGQQSNRSTRYDSLFLVWYIYYLFSWAAWVQATSPWHWRLVCTTINRREFKNSNWKITWRRAFCLLAYLNLLVGLGEELGVTPLSCDWNHWRRRKWNTEYTNRLNPESVDESHPDQPEPFIQSLDWFESKSSDLDSSRRDDFCFSGDPFSVWSKLFSLLCLWLDKSKLF